MDELLVISFSNVLLKMSLPEDGKLLPYEKLAIIFYLPQLS